MSLPITLPNGRYTSLLHQPRNLSSRNPHGPAKPNDSDLALRYPRPDRVVRQPELRRSLVDGQKRFDHGIRLPSFPVLAHDSRASRHLAIQGRIV